MINVHSGEVEIDLAGEAVVLKPTPEAAMQISALHGGFAPVFQRLQNLDLQTAIAVVRFGSGVSGKAAIAQAEQVYRAGIGNIAGDLSIFVANLSRGGLSIDDFNAKATEGNASS